MSLISNDISSQENYGAMLIFLLSWAKKKPSSVKEKASAIPNIFKEKHVLPNVLVFCHVPESLR